MAILLEKQIEIIARGILSVSFIFLQKSLLNLYNANNDLKMLIKKTFLCTNNELAETNISSTTIISDLKMSNLIFNRAVVSCGM